MHVSFIFYSISGLWKIWSSVHIEECLFGCVAVDMLYFTCTGPWMRGVDWLIDFIWVRDLTAPMHLGLNNRPFVPHINQRSPEAPLKFQMAPKNKAALFPQQGSRWPRCLIFYCPLGQKRRNLDMCVWVMLKPHSDLKPEWPPGSKRYSDILFIFLKCPGKRTPSRFPKRAPIEREVRLQGILHISQMPHLSGSPNRIVLCRWRQAEVPRSSVGPVLAFENFSLIPHCPIQTTVHILCMSPLFFTAFRACGRSGVLCI